MKHLSSMTIVLIVLLTSIAVSVALLSIAGPSARAEGGAPADEAALAVTQGTTFSYQGQLKKGGAPANTTCSFQFSLWDAQANGAQAGSTQTLNNIAVSNGLFTVSLDFGSQFSGEARWLQTAVQCTGDANFTTLAPRQAIEAAPYALGLRPGAVMRDSATGDSLYVEKNAANSNAIHGKATATGSIGVWGEGITNTGVYGLSQGGVGVWGLSQTDSGVFGQTALANQAGVKGVNSAANGIGVRGEAHLAGSVGVYGQSNANTGVFGLSTTGVGSWGKSTSGWGMFGESTSNFGVYGKATTSSGVVGVSTSWMGVYGEANAPTGYGVMAVNKSAGTALYAKSDGGGLAAYLDGKTSTRVLEIRAGSDLSERFELSSGKAAEPGMVVVIDENNPGKLRVSDAAYDRKVAGIVSGAGGVATGLTLHQEGVLDGDLVVALVGRVYCQAEAATAPIKAGDFLTTSSVPGHCMKAVDPIQAQGAIIGKAMSELAEGTGLVLVLVNLQ